MATTAKGTPYVEGSDLVSNYPTVSSNLADHIDDKLAYNAVTINAQTGTTYTFALADAAEGKLVTASNAAASTYTVPPQSSAAFADGAVLRILNQGAGTVTVAAGAGVTINGTPLTLAQYKGAAIQRTASNTWTFVPFSGGVGNADFSDAATGTYSSGGQNYKYITYTSSGTLTVTSSGFADLLIVGGGGAGASNRGGGGGAGGYLAITDAYLPSGSTTITVGAGGAVDFNAGSRNGTASRCGSYFVSGGGSGGNTAGIAAYVGNNGGSGGGGGAGLAAGGAGDSGLGNGGGTASVDGDGSAASGGGGGASAVGANGTTGVAGAGGAGTSSSITGSAVSRGGGGGGGAWNGTGGAGGTGGGGAGTGNATTATAGSVNTGGGGGGGGRGATAATGGAGGSGVVIIRVKV